MGVEVRKIETEYAETGQGVPARTEVTYELGFSTPSGGWVRFASVPEHVVVQAEDAAKADQAQPAGSVDLSPPAEGEQPPSPSDTASEAAAPPAQPGDQPGDQSGTQPDGGGTAEQTGTNG